MAASLPRMAINDSRLQLAARRAHGNPSTTSTGILLYSTCATERVDSCRFDVGSTFRLPDPGYTSPEQGCFPWGCCCSSFIYSLARARFVVHAVLPAAWLSFSFDGILLFFGSGLVWLERSFSCMNDHGRSPCRISIFHDQTSLEPFLSGLVRGKSFKALL